MVSRVSLEDALPYANAVLFAVQILLTWFAFTHSDLTSQYDTPITPAGYAFSIWNAIYFFTLMTVITDVAFPGLSIFNYAANPTPLRLCFALSCVFNAGWALLFNTIGAVNVAAVDITLLWLVLLPIYLFLTVERDVRPFRWRQYLCSELSIRLYFSWITAATVVSWTITSQNFTGGYLSLGAYLVLLGVLVVSAILGVVYGMDPVIGLVAVWACVGITQKDVKLIPVVAEREKEVRIQAAATLAAGVVTALVLFSAAEQVITRRRYVSLFLGHHERQLQAIPQ
jgi:translocator protein